MTSAPAQNEDFLRRLRKAAEDNGNRAALRKYWSPATRHQSYPVLGLLGALDDNRKAIIAALFAEHPEHKVGITIGKAALALGDRKEGEHPYDRHFRRLLACDDDLGTAASPGDLPLQLHRLVKRLSRQPVSLDFLELHKNLNYWAKYSDTVKLRWASHFWQAPQLTDTSAEITSQP